MVPPDVPLGHALQTADDDAANPKTRTGKRVL